MRCFTCGSKKGFHSGDGAWTCARCGDEWSVDYVYEENPPGAPEAPMSASDDGPPDIFERYTQQLTPGARMFPDLIRLASDLDQSARNSINSALAMIDSLLSRLDALTEDFNLAVTERDGWMELTTQLRAAALDKTDSLSEELAWQRHQSGLKYCQVCHGDGCVAAVAESDIIHPDMRGPAGEPLIPCTVCNGDGVHSIYLEQSTDGARFSWADGDRIFAGPFEIDARPPIKESSTDTPPTVADK